MSFWSTVLRRAAKRGRPLPPSDIQTAMGRMRPTDPLTQRAVRAKQAAQRPAEELKQGPAIRQMQQSLEEIAAARPAAGVLGAAVGYGTADEEADTAERLKRAFLGGVLGGAVLPGAAQATVLGKTGADKLSNYMFYSYLSSPDTITRANLGAVGGSIVHAFEQFALGVAGNPQSMRNAIATMEAIPEARRIWWHTLKKPESQVRAIRQSIFGMGEGVGGIHRFDIRDQRFRDVGLGRLFSAGDNAGVYAMTQGGLSVDEAMRFTLAGTPTSELGKMVVGGASRLLQSPNPLTRFAGASIAPFARVGMVGLEQGMKRMPGFGLLSSDPRSLKGVRQLEGLGALGAGAAVDEYVDPRLTETLGTVAGPAFLPFQLGRDMAMAHRESPEGLRDPGTFLKGAAQSFKEFSPLGFSPLSILSAQAPEEVVRRLIPSGVADVAEALDPAFGRESGREALRGEAAQGFLPAAMGVPGVGALLSRLPGGRELLPETFAPVDWKGDPLLPDTPEMFDIAAPDLGSSALFPTRAQTLPPVVDYRSDPRLALLSELGEEFEAPSPDVQFPGLAGQLLGPLQMGARTVGDVQKIRGRGKEMSVGVMNQIAPWLMRLPEPYRSRVYRAISQRISRPINAVEAAATRAVGLAGGGRFRP